MPNRSAGLLLYRFPGPPSDPGGEGRGGPALEVLLVHPGGPYWSRRDDWWWSIPKGEVGEDEDDLDAAEREFAEELGVPAPPGARTPLGEVVQAGGKRVRAWAVAADLDVSAIDGGTFTIEWPPRSGRMRTFPEVDAAVWYDFETAERKLLGGQLPLLERLVAVVAPGNRPPTGAGR